MTKKIVLLYSPKIAPEGSNPKSLPYPLLTLAGPLLKEGYDVKIFDRIKEEDAQEKILENLNNAICLGASVWTGYPIADNLELVKKIKKIRPNFPIIWGGWQPSLFPLQTLKDSPTDIVVRGQGEKTFLEVVKCLENNTPLKKILGITYKSNGKIISNPDRPRIPLNELPPYPFHLIDVKSYLSDLVGKRTVSYIASQGCPYNCAFCADARVYKRIRMELSTERVLEDMKYLIEAYNVDSFLFEDTNFFVNKKWLLKICLGIVNNKWDIQWAGCERVDHFSKFNDEELKLIKKSGCNLILAGVESGSQKIIDFLNKGFLVEDIINFTKLCKKYEIAIQFGIMVGIPNETSEDLKKTFKLTKEIYRINKGNRVIYFYYAPYHGTPLYEIIVKKYGFKGPQSLIEWSRFDPTKVATPWVSKEYKEKVDTFLFYLQLAYLNNRYKEKVVEKSRFKIIYLLMHKIALFRFNHNFLSFPIEKKSWNIIRKFVK